MVNSAAYNNHAFVDLEIEDTYFDDERPECYCPFCGHGAEWNVRYCRTCGHAITTRVMAQSGRLGHSFSAAGVNLKRRTSEFREPGCMSFKRSKRELGNDRQCFQTLHIFLGVALLIITIVGALDFLSGNTLF
jgi:hypothetical protein